MFTYIVNKLHVNIFMLYVDKIMIYVYIINLHVDITYLACRGAHTRHQNIQQYIVIPVSRCLCYHREPQSAAWSRNLWAPHDFRRFLPCRHDLELHEGVSWVDLRLYTSCLLLVHDSSSPLFLTSIELIFLLSSPEPKAQVGFSYQNWSVVRRLKNLSSQPLGQFKPNLAQSILGWRGFMLVQTKSHALLQGDTITK